MGLYIPDLRLPADGDFELWIAVGKDGSFTYNVRGDWRDGKQKVFMVPPHGRLIDADAVTLEDGPYEYDDWCKWVLEQYQDAPTVIPASKEG